jgi:hypothetical protein
MKKIFIAIIVTLVFLVATSVQSLADDYVWAEGSEIYGCVKLHKKHKKHKNHERHGNLRIVSELSQCKHNEEGITLIDSYGIQDALDAIYAAIEGIEGGDTSTRFTDEGDGTIRDNAPGGLIWLKDASCIDFDGEHLDNPGRATWVEATQAVAGLSPGSCGLPLSDAGGWRLPTQIEWAAFMSPEHASPALADILHAFTGVSFARYWTSSGNVSMGVVAGSVIPEEWARPPTSALHYVWPVRDPLPLGE